MISCSAFEQGVSKAAFCSTSSTLAQFARLGKEGICDRGSRQAARSRSRSSKSSSDSISSTFLIPLQQLSLLHTE